MSEPRSLPSRPDLRHLRDEARRRRKAGEFPSIALAQLAVAREYGFRSWPRLKFYVEAVTLDASERATALISSATSADLRRAQALLGADPALARHDLACAAPPVRRTRSHAGSRRGRPRSATPRARTAGRRSCTPASRDYSRRSVGRPASARSCVACSPPARTRTPRSSRATGSRSPCTAPPGSPATPS